MKTDKPTRKEPIEQKVRKVLQSVALHGYDLICAEHDILKATEQYRTEGLREEHKCKSCGEPLSEYCDRCQHLWET